MLDTEETLDADDIGAIRAAIEELRKELEAADLRESARIALLEMVRLSRNALDYYSIHGSRGFKEHLRRRSPN